MSGVNICSHCLRSFNNYSSLWRHLNTKKTACIPREDHLQLNQEYSMDKSKLDYFQIKTTKQKIRIEKLEEENNRLQQLVSQIGDIKNNLQSIESGIDNVGNKINDVENKIDTKETNFNTAFNNCTINQLLHQDMNFMVKLALPEKERFDHISKEEMLAILNHSNFENSIDQLISAVYFDPRAPQNMHWCVTDKTAKFGALEYNYELHTVSSKNPTDDVIVKNLQSVIYGMGDILEELRNTCIFNDQQGVNYSKYYGMVGCDTFKQQYINRIKERAYIGRNFTKALWEQLEINLEKTNINPRMKLI
jgi:hypothetical protein